MSDIPVSTVVRVTISTAPTFPTRKGFGTLNIIGPSNVISAAERFRVYSNMDGVEGDFDPATEEYRAAQTYWAQRPSPQQLVISRRVATAIPAELRGGGNPEIEIAVWQAILDGSLRVNIDGIEATVGSLDFSTADTLPEVAALVQVGIRAANVALGWANATCTYEANRFYIRSGTTGPASTIGYGLASVSGTDIVPLLALALGDATKMDGLAPESALEALVGANDASQDWYGFAFTRELRDDLAELEPVAEWAEARVKIFANDSNDNDILDSVNTNDIAYALKQRGFRRSFTCYNFVANQYLAISALARAFVVNFSARNSTITLKFKQMPGITPTPLRTSQKNALDAKQANAFYTVGGNPMFGEGVVAAQGVFFDEVHGIDWLQNAIETNVFGKLYTDITKTPMTDPGTASLQQQVEKALDEAVNNGLAAPGFDRDDNYLQKGYVTSVQPMREHNQSDKEARQGPPISFTVLGAGAIHGIEIIGVFQR